MKNKLIEVIPPELCMDAEKNAIAFVLRQIATGEPASLIGMIDMGKDVLFSTLIEEIQLKKLPYTFKFLHATTRENLQLFLQDIERDLRPTLCVINLSIHEDVLEYIDTLDKIRRKRSVQFVSVLISNIRDVHQALVVKKKSVSRSLFILSPVTFEDTSRLIASFERRFTFKASEHQKKDIHKWSQGHLGLIKTLFLLIKNNPDYAFIASKLLLEESILHRLYSICNDLPSENRKRLGANMASLNDKLFFEKFGYWKNGKIFNPLLQIYIEKNNAILPINISNNFTNQEKKIFVYLKSHIDELIPRNTVAKLIWEDKLEEKYSNWAIDQMIHKLRVKLKKIRASYEIVTKKRQGFILVPIEI